MAGLQPTVGQDRRKDLGSLLETRNLRTTIGQELSGANEQYGKENDGLQQELMFLSFREDGDMKDIGDIGHPV
ncbi:MAG: hypothetical protein KIY12_08800 [Thermoplasmata archaeon]|uniref:Uncharacterized protein n=1 Tax=Candidatus Sysuiplasma superficiale TaxID=2823368 RepID=A0A8J8CDW3_9ARCH|nr:hypothetical protein [Candidatus Sysuiplasma superficiale]